MKRLLSKPVRSRKAARKGTLLKNRPVRKKKKKTRSFSIPELFGGFGSAFFKVFAVASGVVAISMCFVTIYHFMLRSPYLKLKEVDVRGVAGDLRRELIIEGGLSPSKSLLDLNLSRTKHLMERHPWIRSVSIERKFPHTLIVEAEKEIPRALVLLDRLYYMNSYGEIFKPVMRGEDRDYPVVTGTSKETAEAMRQLAETGYVMDVLASREGKWSVDNLSEIHFNRDGELSLYFSDFQAEIRLVAGGVEEKMDGLERLTETLARSGRMTDVRGIDLEYDKGAVVSFKEG